MNKYAHVRGAKLDPTRSHECHWPGCKLQVAAAKWGCKSHWEALPKDIRAAIWDAYEIGQEDDPNLVSEAYIEASKRALAWIDTNKLADSVSREMHEKPLNRF
jgi:hypothetical protein